MPGLNDVIHFKPLYIAPCNPILPTNGHDDIYDVHISGGGGGGGGGSTPLSITMTVYMCHVCRCGVGR